MIDREKNYAKYSIKSEQKLKKSLVKTPEGKSSFIKNASSFLRLLFLLYKINLTTQAFR